MVLKNRAGHTLPKFVVAFNKKLNSVSELIEITPTLEKEYENFLTKFNELKSALICKKASLQLQQQEIAKTQVFLAEIENLSRKINEAFEKISAKENSISLLERNIRTISASILNLTRIKLEIEQSLDVYKSDEDINDMYQGILRDCMQFIDNTQKQFTPLSTKYELAQENELTTLIEIQKKLMKLQDEIGFQEKTVKIIFNKNNNNAEERYSDTARSEYNAYLLEMIQDWSQQSLLTIQDISNQLSSIQSNEEVKIQIIALYSNVHDKLHQLQNQLKHETNKNNHLKTKIKERACLVKLFQAENISYLKDRAKRFKIKDFFFSKDKIKRTQYVAKLNSALENYKETGDAIEVSKQIAEGKKNFTGKIFSPLVLESIEQSIKSFESQSLQTFNNENHTTDPWITEKNRLIQLFDEQCRPFLTNKSLWCKHRFFCSTQVPIQYIIELKTFLKTGDKKNIDDEIAKGLEQYKNLPFASLVLQPLQIAINDILTSAQTSLANALRY